MVSVGGEGVSEEEDPKDAGEGGGGEEVKRS